ncbi:hypothetical protein RHSIM_Rhsim11G0015800 [Rhododendron simsii]|uniref:Uncharacterized protein n=1 Tax=Rhododendron simsii TaxID=118357 RepID=A0A834G8H9_RHOSS|nr:hypothetical protein RHSIM_Rhsim11G0015800 [Rhododendron simsii]
MCRFVVVHRPNKEKDVAETAGMLPETCRRTTHDDKVKETIARVETQKSMKDTRGKACSPSKREKSSKTPSLWAMRKTTPSTPRECFWSSLEKSLKNTRVPESSKEKARLLFISTMELVGVLSSFVSSSVLCNCRKTQTRSFTQPRVNFICI